MPINFVTGLPRQGKTLWTLFYVRELAQKQNRPVYYCNIPEVTLDSWQEIDHPDKWMELPNDSIIVVDELQDFWGMASSGARVPLPILELSKHGKRGIDFFFITQDPTLVHQTPRKLAAAHYHVIRIFGSQKAMIHKWPRMQTDPERAKRTSEKFPWAYPLAAFGKRDKAGNWITRPWYKSADVHNIKREIPLKVWAIPGGVLLAGLAVWAGVKIFSNMLDKAKGSTPSTEQIAIAPAARGGSSGGMAPGVNSGSRDHKTTAQYVLDYRPRLADFAFSAPIYDQVTQPVEAPYPAACVAKSGMCKCYSQQATVLRVSEAVCLQIVKEGFFVDWKLPQREAQPRQMQASQAPNQPHQQQYQSVPIPVQVPVAQTPQAPAQDGYLEALAKRNAQVRSVLN